MILAIFLTAIGFVFSIHFATVKTVFGLFWRDGYVPPPDLLAAAERVEHRWENPAFFAAVSLGRTLGTFLLTLGLWLWTAASVPSTPLFFAGRMLLVLVVVYTFGQFLPRMFAWTGHLASGASEEVLLPHLIDMRPGTNTFTVVLGDPNGRKDKNKANNTLSTTFTAAPALGSPLTVRLRTPIGNGGTLRVESTRGPVLLERKWDAHTDTVLRETLMPANGSYFLTVADSGRAGGPATVRVLDAAGVPVKTLQSSARSGNQYQFRVDINSPDTTTVCVTDVLPRPGRGTALVEVHCARAGEVVIRDPEDEPVDGWAVPAWREVVQRVDLGAHKSGTYRVFFRQGEDERDIGRIVVP